MEGGLITPPALIGTGPLMGVTSAQMESHRQFKHPSKPGRVTIAGRPFDELAKGTQMSILKQAGLRGSEQP